jgi:multicomponent Na+:H+ antiporter subunit C
MEFLLSILTGLLFTGAFYMMLRRSLVKLIFGLVLFSHASNLLIFTLGRLTKGIPPVITEEADQLSVPYADPMPQAMILTAIVISFGIQAFAIVLIKRVFEEVGSDDLDKLTSTDKP